MNYVLKSWCKSTFVVMMVFALSHAAMAQLGNSESGSGSGSMIATTGQSSYNNLYDALKDQNVATTMTGAQLTSDWHIISSGEIGILAMYGVGKLMPQLAGYTQGKLVSFGSEKYLVAYYAQDQGDTQDMDSSDPSRSAKGYLFKDSTLSLALLPMNGHQSFYEIKKFDPEKDYLSKPIVTSADSQSNLRQIALVMSMYTQDYDEKYPPMIAARRASDIVGAIPDGVPAAPPSGINDSNGDVVQNRLGPYTKSSSIFLQPVTHRPYLPNYKISRQTKWQIKNPSQVFMFYEDAPDADGKRNVAFADGHVEALTEDQFQWRRKAQGISESGYPPAAKVTQKAKATPKP